MDAPDTNTWMPEIWEELINRYRVRSVLDVGCGGGFTAKWFLDRGLHAVGIEGYPPAIARNVLPNDHLIVWDYTRGPMRPMDKFDLCWCAEFVEHVKHEFMPNFVETFRKCHYVAMTHARPGQGGHHHVNEQTLAYWEDQLGARGFELLPLDTLKLRDLHPVTGPWGVQTLLFFKNTNW